MDWQPFVRRHWERAPTTLSLGAPLLPTDATFRALIELCAPFRFGTRFRTLPDVRLHVADGQLTGPGTLLPGREDASVEDYLRRAASGLGGQPFELLVEQPFLLDFARWNTLRGFLRGLLERVGVPVLPIGCELLVGQGHRPPPGLARREHHSVLLLVLHGTLLVSHADGDAPLTAHAGQLLYLPSRQLHRVESLEECMAVRLAIPLQASHPTEVVQDVLLSLLEDRLAHDEEVPYLPFADTARAPRIPLLERTADALRALAREQDLQQALRIVWARRVSACGLDPAPAPDTPAPLTDAQHVRGQLRGNLVRMRERTGPWIWALHGHVFPGLGTSQARRLLEALDDDEPPTVGALCATAKRGRERAELRTVLGRLHQLRGIQVVRQGGG
ncbi:hypothetical protein LZ198_00530 [Myxococcus sp. K15C18031901]|uniref:hypothetical protein n=1 Tax=Myxococcus dinghuensis TaxID=2906761 RepID=UPI0020A78C4D|nr:hypothetical protein [Myxococcus dinghuensis]MCP3097350.1 hypothetical protein [Myxococcus dinghuensis]